MGHRLLLQRLPAAWNCSFIQYGKQVAGAALAHGLLPQNCARAYTKSGCLLCASICMRNQDTGQRNSVPPTAPLNNHKTTQLCIYTSVSAYTCIASCPTITEPRLCTRTQALPQCLPVFASRRLPAVDMYLHAYSGELAQHLPALPPLDNPPQLCACTHTRARLLNSTNAASCRHRSWTRTSTNIWASWHSSYRCCIASTSGPGQVYAHMVSQAGTVHTGVASC